MVQDIASCHRQHIGNFHANTHSHKNHVNAEKALKTLISTSNPAGIKRVDSPVNAILAMMAIGAVARPVGNGITRVANNGQLATNDPRIATSPSSTQHSASLLPGAHAIHYGQVPSDAGAGSGLQELGERMVATGLLAAAKQHPCAAGVTAGGLLLTGLGLGISGTYAYLRDSCTRPVADPAGAMAPTEDLPQPAALASGPAATLNNDCAHLIQQFTSLKTLNVDRMLRVDLRPIGNIVDSMMRMPLDDITIADLNDVADCVGSRLRSSKVLPLIEHVESMKQGVLDGTALSIEAPFSELRRNAILNQLNTVLTGLRGVSRKLYQLTVSMNDKTLEAAG